MMKGDDEGSISAVSPIWHKMEFQYNFADGLSPYFAADSRVKAGGGSLTTDFSRDGERWLAKLHYQPSNIQHPGSRLPTGTDWGLQTIREFRIKIRRAGAEDDAGQQSMNVHLRPRWQGMTVETKYGDEYELNIPEGISEGVNLHVQGSNIDAFRYLPIIRAAAHALDINPDHFRDPHGSSTVQDAERYVRVHEDASGPVHARDGPIAQMGHLLENDREGYRKIEQADDDNHGRNVPGFRHMVTLGPSRAREAFPSHSVPVRVKHYRTKESLKMEADNPLKHPKVEVSYRQKRWDDSVGVKDDNLRELQRQLDRTLHAVLSDAGIDVGPPTDGGPPYVPDAYFAAEIGEHHTFPSLDLAQIENQQENIVIRELTAGFSPVEEEALHTLVTDGGKVSPADIADKHNRHVGSVRRALRRIDDMVDRKYGEVALSSPHVASMVHEAVHEMRQASNRMVETAGEALLAAERGIDETAGALRTWCANHGVEVDSRGEAIRSLRMGEIDLGGTDGLDRLRYQLENGLRLWADAGRPAEAFRAATVRFVHPEHGPRRMEVATLLR